MDTNIPIQLTQQPIDGYCQPSFDAENGSKILLSNWRQKEIHVIEYGQTIAVNPKLTVSVDKFFDRGFTKGKTVMGRSVYAARETDDAIRIIVYDRKTMAHCSALYSFNDIFSILILLDTPDDAEELVENFDLDEYKKYVKDFRKKYHDILYQKEDLERIKYTLERYRHGEIKEVSKM